MTIEKLPTSPPSNEKKVRRKKWRPRKNRTWTLVKDMVDTGFLATGKQSGTYYASDKGLSLLEQGRLTSKHIPHFTHQKSAVFERQRFFIILK